MGTCNNFSVAWLVECRTQKPKCMGSNHGVDNSLVDLARENILIEWLLCDVEVLRSTWGKSVNGVKVSKGRGHY